MKAHAALVLKDTYTPDLQAYDQFRTQWIFLENYGIVLAKIFKFLRLYVIFELIFCCVHIL